MCRASSRFSRCGEREVPPNVRPDARRAPERLPEPPTYPMIVQLTRAGAEIPQACTAHLPVRSVSSRAALEANLNQASAAVVSVPTLGDEEVGWLREMFAGRGGTPACVVVVPLSIGAVQRLRTLRSDCFHSVWAEEIRGATRHRRGAGHGKGGGSPAHPRPPDHRHAGDSADRLGCRVAHLPTAIPTVPQPPSQRRPQGGRTPSGEARPDRQTGPAVPHAAALFDASPRLAAPPRAPGTRHRPRSVRRVATRDRGPRRLTSATAHQGPRPGPSVVPRNVRPPPALGNGGAPAVPLQGASQLVHALLGTRAAPSREAVGRDRRAGRVHPENHRTVIRENLAGRPLGVAASDPQLATRAFWAWVTTAWKSD